MTPARRRSLVLTLSLAVLAAAALAWLLLARDDDRPSLGAQVAARQAKVGECLRERARELEREGKSEAEREREEAEGGGEGESERERECPGAPESNEDLAKISSSVVS